MFGSCSAPPTSLLRIYSVIQDISRVLGSRTRKDLGGSYWDEAVGTESWALFLGPPPATWVYWTQEGRGAWVTYLQRVEGRAPKTYLSSCTTVPQGDADHRTHRSQLTSGCRQAYLICMMEFTTTLDSDLPCALALPFQNTIQIWRESRHMQYWLKTKDKNQKTKNVQWEDFVSDYPPSLHSAGISNFSGGDMAWEVRFHTKC